MRIRRLAGDFLRQLGWFSAATLGVVTLLLLALPFIGYLPYSDRPGPGWYGFPRDLQWPEVREHLKFVAGFALMAAVSIPLLAPVFAIPFSVVRFSQRRGLPGPLIRLLGASLTGLLAWYLIGSIGWYISLGWVGALPGIAAGAAAGACCLPRRRASISMPAA